MLDWIRCFLSNRTHQCVVVEQCKSTFQKVISGIPQGSVLGPILFLIYINDIDSVCCGDSHLQLFADDAKLYSSISIGSPSVSLQHSLDNLISWANAWQLKINIGKCAVISLGSSSLSSDFAYYIDGISIAAHTSQVDLGITISQDLSFHAHINNIVCKARQRVSTLFRGFTSRNHDILRRTFITNVRPTLEYNSVVWSPCTKHLIDLLEGKQRNFFKRIPSLSSYSYTETCILKLRYFGAQKT